MSVRPSAELRRLVTARANDCCEYCLMPQMFVASRHQVDHIIAEKHGGLTIESNLALCCMLCNLRKGSDIASLDPDTSEVTALFHPRQTDWKSNFRLQDAMIVGTTPTGKTTALFLQLNMPDRLIERSALISAGVNLVDPEIKKPR